MTDIALKPLQRTGLPPSRVGEVKPPLSLADTSAEAGLAFATAQFAGGLFDNVVKAKAANEHAEFQGFAAAEMQAFDTLVVSKPGASFEELESERNKMVARIEAAGKKATTKSAQQSNKNWMLRNKGNIYAQTQTSMEAIRTRQALAAFNLHRKNLITNFKGNELTDLYAGQVESRLMTKEFAKAQLAVDLSVIDEAEKKIIDKTAIDTALAQARALFDETGDEKAALDIIRDSTKIPEDQKQQLQGDLRAEIGYRQSITDRKEADAQEKSQSEIYSAIVGGETPADQIIDNINALTAVGSDGVQPLTIAQAERLKGIMASPVKDTPINVQIGVEVLLSSLDGTRKKQQDVLNSFMKLSPKISATDGSGYIKRIFSITEQKQDSQKAVLLAEVDDAVNLIRSRIEQKDPFGFGEQATIRRFVANQAEIDMRRKFPEDSDFATADIDKAANDIMKKYSLGEGTFERLMIEQGLADAETAAEQVAVVKDSIKRLRGAGKIDEAKSVLQEAIDIGLIDRNELDGGSSKKKEPVNQSKIKRLIDAIGRSQQR